MPFRFCQQEWSCRTKSPLETLFLFCAKPCLVPSDTGRRQGPHSPSKGKFTKQAAPQTQVLSSSLTQVHFPFCLGTSPTGHLLLYLLLDFIGSGCSPSAKTAEQSHTAPTKPWRSQSSSDSTTDSTRWLNPNSARPVPHVLERQWLPASLSIHFLQPSNSSVTNSL